ncbi:unnamed protein product [Musa banksii]
MGSSQTMDSAFHLFLLPNASALPSIAAVIVFAISVLWLYPGGLAWALCRADRSIPGPPGHGPPPLRIRRAPCPRQARRVAQSLRLDGLLPRLHTLRLVKPPRHGPGDPQQLGLRRSPCPYELLFHRAMDFAPFGEYWRNLRRITATYLFRPTRSIGRPSVSK